VPETPVYENGELEERKVEVGMSGNTLGVTSPAGNAMFSKRGTDDHFGGFVTLALDLCHEDGAFLLCQWIFHK